MFELRNLWEDGIDLENGYTLKFDKLYKNLNMYTGEVKFKIYKNRMHIANLFFAGERDGQIFKAFIVTPKTNFINKQPYKTIGGYKALDAIQVLCDDGEKYVALRMFTKKYSQGFYSKTKEYHELTRILHKL